MNRQRGPNLVILLLVPAVVSLVVTLGILRLWEGRQADDVYILPTDSPTSQVVAADDDDVTLATQPEGESVATGEPCENPVHTVQSGETLGSISQSYDVLLAELIEVNQLANPDFNADFISVNQSIIIPLCGIPTPTPEPEPTATERATSPAPIPTTTNPPAGTVDIRIERVIRAGDVTEEGVEIINEGTPLNLNGWVLTNGEQEYVFPGFSIFTGGSVTVYTGVGEDDVRSLYWGLTEALWTPGTTVELYNPAGELISSSTVEE